MAVIQTFDDEFSAFSLWNGSSGTWNTDAAWGSVSDNGYTLASNGEQEWYINSTYAPTSSITPWTVSNGILTLTAAPASAGIQSLINGYQYTSGQLNTYHSFSQTYGFFEERAQLPAGQGLWPAFWLMPENGSWPPELDIMEMLGQNTSTYYTTVHDNALPNTYVGQADNVVNMSTGYHTYAVDWEPNFITFYFDGQEVDQIATPADMNTPMYMITNLAVGGGWPGDVNSSTPMPAQMNIDFIRAYSSMPSWISDGQDPTDIGSGGSGGGSGSGSGSGTGGGSGSGGGGSGGTVPTGTSATDYTAPDGVTSVVMTSASAQTIHANDLGDTIAANDAVSRITGGAGNDTEIAGHNADILTGGGGADTFEFNFVPWTAGHVTDFTPGTDKIDLSAILNSYGYTGTNPLADGWVSLQSDGAGDTQVYVNSHDGSYPWLITTLDHVAPTSLSAVDFGSGASGPPSGSPGMPQGTVLGPIETMPAPAATTGAGGSATATRLPASPVYENGSGLVVNVTYDQSQSSLPTGFVAAVDYVVSYLESVFSTPTTVNVDVGYGEIGGQTMASNALGESETYLGAYNYSTVKSALAASDPSAAAGLPANMPAGTMWVPTAEAKALGLAAQQAATNVDGYVGFSSSLPFTYDPNNQAVPGKYDFIGVLEHEFSEVMGRIDLFGDQVGNTTSYSPLDMFHYTAPGVHTYTGTTPNYFSANGGVTNLDNFNSNPSGDLGDWASSAGADAFLAFSPSGQATDVSRADLTEMNALGYAGARTSTVIEADGSTVLVLTGENYYLDPSSGGLGVSLNYHGAAVFVGEFGGWTPIGAEATASGYEVALKDVASGLYTVWDTDSNGNYLSNAIGAVPGSSLALEAVEPSFHQDLNGDGTIGILITAIQTDGSTTLAEAGNDYYLDPSSGGLGVSLNYHGAAVFVGEFGGWTPIGAEATASGYEVALKDVASGLYTVWDTDSNGNYLSNAIGAVPGSSLALEAVEPSFHQDLNGDGTIGILITAIQTDGSTTLAEAGNDYYLDPSSGGLGVSLNYHGAAVFVGEFGGWTPIGAEATASGYEVALKDVASGLYTVWDTDSNGNYLSNAIGAVPGSSLALEAVEPSFHQDLNGDGTIGILITAIQTDGSTTLAEAGNDYYLDPSSGGLGVSLNYHGAAVFVGEFGGWTPIGAEATASGYEVALKDVASGLYTVWDTDSNGNYLSNAIGAVPGSSLTLEEVETSFQQDLNHDGTIGPPTTLIQADGSTSLVEMANEYFLNPTSGGQGPSLNYMGSPVVTGEFGPWNPIGAIQTSTGYQVALEDAAAGLYTIWSTDSNGNYLSNAIGAVPGSSLTLEEVETSFQQDLNHDGTIGPPTTLIQADGSTSLVEMANEYFLNPTSGGQGPSLNYMGSPVVTGEFGAWHPIGAIQTSTGYEVAWQDDQGNYTIWNTDANGNFVSGIGAVSETSLTLESAELTFHQDLNHDGTIGVPPPTHLLI